MRAMQQSFALQCVEIATNSNNRDLKLLAESIDRNRTRFVQHVQNCQVASLLFASSCFFLALRCRDVVALRHALSSPFGLIGHCATESLSIQESRRRPPSGVLGEGRQAISGTLKSFFDTLSAP